MEKAPRRRGCSVNGSLVKLRREKQGWTQEELAKVSGYSVRLIAKAEAGGPIQSSTIRDLAKSLSTDSSPLCIDDLLCLPKQLAMEFLHNLEHSKTHTVEKTRHFIADDVVFTISGDPAVLPFAGEHHGVEAMSNAVQCFFQTLTIHSFEVASCIEEGNEVVATLKIRAVAQGVEIEPEQLTPTLVVNHFYFQRGKLQRLDDYFQEEPAEIEYKKQS